MNESIREEMEMGVSCVAAAAAALAACGSTEPEAEPAQAEPTAASMTQPTAAAMTQPATAAPATATQVPATAMPEPTAAMAESAPSVEVGLDVGQRAPDFMLTGHDGESITLASLEGRPVVLYFYTTW